MIDQSALHAQLGAQAWGSTGINASLWFNKYLEAQSRDEKENRKKLIQEVATLPESEEYRRCFGRWKNILAEEYHAQTRRIRVKGRMIVGLGSESILETSICLHRTYGVPFIPGSALKGLAASYAHQCLSGEWQRGGTFHTIVFGKTEEAGYITFLDALSIPGTGLAGGALSPDVITVHHQKYYQGEQDIPAESDNPNPVPFLSATGTYLLALAAPDLQEPTRWLDLTFQILAKALAEWGIGAKTSSGYGRMEFLDPPVRPIDPELQLAENYKNQVEALNAGSVAGQIESYYRKWQQLTLPAARTLLAQAIVEKVRRSGRERASAGKRWYQELLAFLDVRI